RLKKRIPVGAGMAGGSTDGAAVLRALNRLCGRPFDAEALRAIGLTLGSDVPYCVQGGSMLAGGRGEKLTPLPMPPECHVVIAKPVFSLSTAELFSRVDGRHARTRPDTRGLICAMEQGDLPGMARRMFNVFEDVLPRHCGEVASIRGTLLEAGALGSVMTGTGSAVFGVFAGETAAKAAAGQLRSQYRDVCCTKFIDTLEI
ncbi:MAG: 4-(cytidine 5'-diphospho)-2-C-methyl-D-erythritol kinase, partial [Oscillospiraceae bacterium]|nr:4-(cytidine 5'-diphospho)-2-C-methyl-D-erythritol kinase [Oscillospiraceae bacterium]